jgi:hypothetical protein
VTADRRFTDLQILTEPRSQSGTVTVGIQRKLLNLLMQEQLRQLKPYQPGKPIEEVKMEYGLEKVVKLASNEKAQAAQSPDAAHL